MKSSNRYKDIQISKFLKRKNTNKKHISKYCYDFFERENSKIILLKKTTKGKIIGSACCYCFSHTKNNPYKNGAYVFSICSKCLENVEIIEEHISPSKKKLKKIKSKEDPLSVSFDWILIEKLIDNKKAKLTLLANKYNIYPEDMKQALVNRYKNKVVFKRGRGGGVQLI